MPAIRTVYGRYQGRRKWTKSSAQTPHSATGAAHRKYAISTRAYPVQKKAGELYPKPLS